MGGKDKKKKKKKSKKKQKRKREETTVVTRDDGGLENHIMHHTPRVAKSGEGVKIMNTTNARSQMVK